MPSKGTTKINRKQKSAMAVGKLSGLTSTEVAGSLGVHPVTVRQYWGGYESLTLQLKQEHALEIARLFAMMLKGLAGDVASNDPYIRMRAYQRISHIVIAGDPPLERVAAPPPPPQDGEVLNVTLEELLLSYRQATMRADSNSSRQA